MLRGLEGMKALDRGDAVTLPTLAILAGSGVALLTTLGARIVMARALTPAELGFVLLGVAVVSGVGGVASLGLSPATGRRVADLVALGKTAEARACGRSAVATAAVTGTVGAALVVVAGGLVTSLPKAGPLGGILAFLAPVALGLAPGYAMVGVARGFGDYFGRPLIRDAGGGLLRLVAITVAVMAGSGPRWIAFGFMVGSVVGEGGFLTYGMLRGWVSRVPARWWDRELWRGLRPFSVMELLSQLTQWTDMLVLGALGAPAAVGFYGVARSFSRALEIVHVSAAHNFLPAVTAALHGVGRDELVRVYVRTRTFIFALMWPFLALCIAAPAAVVGRLFGAPYLPAAPILRLLGLALLLRAMFGYKDLALIALDRAAFTARVGAVSFAGGLVVMLALVPFFGGEGAATAVLVMTVMNGIALAKSLWRVAGVRPWVEDLPPRVVGSIGLTAVAWLVANAVSASATATAAWVVAAAAVGSLWVVLSLYPEQRPVVSGRPPTTG
jgi:O-antigen/teichoic acid export membrane protein